MGHPVRILTILVKKMMLDPLSPSIDGKMDNFAHFPALFRVSLIDM